MNKAKTIIVAALALASLGMTCDVEAQQQPPQQAAPQLPQPRAQPWLAISTAKDCATMRRRGRGIHLIPRAGLTAAVAKPTCAAPAATGCSIASPPSKAVPFRRSVAWHASGRRGITIPDKLLIAADEVIE